MKETILSSSSGFIIVEFQTKSTIAGERESDQMLLFMFSQARESERGGDRRKYVRSKVL